MITLLFVIVGPCLAQTGAKWPWSLWSGDGPSEQPPLASTGAIFVDDLFNDLFYDDLPPLTSDDLPFINPTPIFDEEVDRLDVRRSKRFTKLFNTFLVF